MALTVIFDMDGLMFDTERIYADVERKIASEWQMEGIEEILYESFGANINYIRNLYLTKYGSSFDFDGYLALTEKNVYKFYEDNDVPIKDGLFEMLDFLDSVGIKKAVATSTFFKHAKPLLEAANVYHRFDEIVTGDMVKNSKPAPDIFLRAAELLGAEASDCVVLEDSFNGIKGAYAAKMMPVMIPDIKKPTEEIKSLTYAIVDDLHKAIVLIKDLYNKKAK